MAKISILIPVYNVPRDLLKKCIHSVINQSYKDIEIIIVDDGSNYKCASLCNEFAEKDNRIKVFHKANGGLSSARNFAVKKVNSKWFTFLDGDDWIEKDTCENIIKLLDDKVDLIVYGMIRNQNEKTFLIPMKYYREVNYIGKECEILRKMVLDHDSFISSSVAKVYNTNYIRKNDLYHSEELKCGMEGIEFVYRVFSLANNVKISDFYGYHYVYNEESLSAIPSMENNNLTMKGINKIRDYANMRGYDDIHLIDKRQVYSIMAIVTRSFFNPRLKKSYASRKNEYIEFLKEHKLSFLLKNIRYKEYPLKKYLLLFLIKHKLYFLLYTYATLSQARFS